MASIGSLSSAGYSTTTVNSLKKELNAAKDEYSSLTKNKNISSEERTSLQKEYKEKIESLNKQITDAEDEALSAMSSNVASASGVAGLFGGGNMDSFSMFGNAQGGGGTGFDFFFGANNTLQNLSVINKARQSIENRARSLTSEIKMDKMRGINTEGKMEALANLTSNLTMMDDNLSNNINKTLTEEKDKDVTYTPIINKIKDQLSAEQKKQEAEGKKMQDAANNKYGVSDAEKA